MTLESFGLMNLIKSVLESTNSDKNREETQDKASISVQTNKPQDPVERAEENNLNGFLSFMERHDKISRNIDKNSPKK